MKVHERYTPWRERQARWSIPDLALAIKLQCQECNQEERFLDSNDCVSSSCPLYPFRPGACRPEVAGIRRATRARRGSGNLANLRSKREMTAPERASAPLAGGNPDLPRRRQAVAR
jgi:hypothetical protein